MALDQKGFNFSWAFLHLKNGGRVTNLDWNGESMYLEIQFPDEHSKMKEPYFYIKNSQGRLVPWTPSQLDLFSNRWVEVRKED